MTSKFSAAGTTPATLAGRKPEPVGLKATDANVTRNWRWVIGVTIVVIIVAAFAGVAFVYATGVDKPYQVREDSLKNVKESRNVEIFLQVRGPQAYAHSTISQSKGHLK